MVRSIRLAIPVFALAAGAAPVMAQSVQVITPARVRGAVAGRRRPSAPPAPRYEAVPPPPSEQARVMYWRPGHWMWDGASWAWSQGQYVERPAPQAVWEPGHWVQQPTGGYIWVDGRWAG